MSEKQRTVFVPNKNQNDFSAAEAFGKLVFLTEGPISRFAVQHLHKLILGKLQDASAEDYVMVTSLNILTAISSSILAARFKRVNFLLYSQMDGYTERSIILE